MSSLKCGIVGLPNVGKSTLFNALLKKRVALSANYPFATVEPNVGVVAVPDGRLGKLADLIATSTSGESPSTVLGTSKPTPEVLQRPPIVPAVVEFVDIAGLVKGASTGAGLGNQFLSHIREVDAIVHVLRDFEDSNIIREGSENPDADKLTIETELGLADLQTLEKLVLAQEKQVRVSKDALEQQKLEILKQMMEELNQGRVLGKYQVGDERLKDWFSSLPLLSIKPVLFVYNVAESNYASSLRDHEVATCPPSLRSGAGRREQSSVEDRHVADAPRDDKLVICAKLEEELADLSEPERLEYLKELGIEETGLERLIKKAYSLLGLISFLTAGPKEVRAWTIKKGALAPQAAGVIHTDFEKKFIRAQVIEYEKLIEAGSYAVAKQKGWMRTEGKDYMIRDGDVVEFLIGS